MDTNFSSLKKIEQKINGSRKLSNYLVGGMLTIGGVGFILASLSSYTFSPMLRVQPCVSPRRSGMILVASDALECSFCALD